MTSSAIQFLAQTPNAAQQAADTFAQSVGESGMKVVDPQWRSLLTKCCVIDTHCSWWRAEAKLTFEDIGLGHLPLADQRRLDRIFNLGERYLLPKHVIKNLQKLENARRQNMYRRTIGSLWGRVLAGKNYKKWRDEDERIQAEFMSTVLAVADHWDELQEQVRQDTKALAHNNYKTMRAMGINPEMSEDAWVGRFVNRAMAKTITREQWVKRASMTTDKGYIPLQSMLGQSDVEAMRLAAAKAAADGDEMGADIAASAAHQLDMGLYRFMQDMRTAISQNVVDVVADCLAAFKKNEGVLPRNSSKQLKNLIQKVDEMVFWDEPTLTAQMQEIQAHLGIRSDLRSKSDVEQSLQALGTQAKLLLAELDRPAERSTVDLGIPDITEHFEDVQVASRAQTDWTDWDDVDFDVANRQVVDMEPAE